MAGRPVGSKNNKANELKNAILHSLDRVGGVEYLVKQATDNPVAYMGLIGKVIPKDMAIEIKKSIFEDESQPTDSGVED